MSVGGVTLGSSLDAVVRRPPPPTPPIDSESASRATFAELRITESMFGMATRGMASLRRLGRATGALDAVEGASLTGVGRVAVAIESATVPPAVAAGRDSGRTTATPA